jgi:hypothetical protein
MSKKPILSALVVVAAAYAAYPYVALYRLQAALRSGNSATLAAMIDWDQVRDGLKDQIAEDFVGSPAPATGTMQTASAELPAFGASFIKGVASNAVDSEITPEAVVRMVGHTEALEEGEPDPLRAVAVRNTRITWAFFGDPTTFTLWLRTPNEAPGDDPVKLRMQLRDGNWKITRVWLPPTLLHAAR